MTDAFPIGSKVKIVSGVGIVGMMPPIGAVGVVVRVFPSTVVIETDYGYGRETWSYSPNQLEIVG